MQNSRLLLLVCSSLLGLLLIEAGARSLLPAPRFHRAPLEFDQSLGFRAIPSQSTLWQAPDDPTRSHVVRINRHGFRGRRLPSGPAPAGVDRIVFVGDSFLVAEAVAEAALVTSRVERELALRGAPAEVYNLSTIDYGTGQQLLLLDRFAPALQPDRIVLFLYPMNDVANNARGLAGLTRVSPGDPIRPYLQVLPSGDYEVAWIAPLRSWLRRSSRAFALLEARFAPPAIDSVRARAAQQRLREGSPPREFLEVLREHDPGHPWEVAWRETESLLRVMRDRSTALGAEFWVVVVPGIDQVEWTPKRIGCELQAAAAGRSLAELVDWNLPERRLQRFFAQEGIPALLLLPAFRSAAARGRSLYARDLHLSAEGHALAAEHLLAAWADPSVERPADADTRRSTPDPRIAGQPVAWPAPTDPSWLDFEVSAYPAHLGDGWIRWQAPRVGRAGGWLLGRTGLIALRAGAGEVVVRGHASSAVDFGLGLAGGHAKRVALTGPGAFELRLPESEKPHVSSTGHVAIVLDTGSSVGQVVIQAVGFERTLRASHPPASGSGGQSGPPARSDRRSG